MDQPRPGPPESWKENWTDHDFRHRTDHTGWTKSARDKFKEARKAWRLRTPDCDKKPAPEQAHSASNRGKLGGASADQSSNATKAASIAQRERSDSGNRKLGISLRSAKVAAGTPSDSSIKPGQEGKASSKDPAAIKESTETTAPESTSSTQPPWYSIHPMASNPAADTPAPGRTFGGDMKSTDVNQFVSANHRALTAAKPSNQCEVAYFTANHLVLNVKTDEDHEKGPEYARVYSVTVVRKQKPNGMKDAPLRKPPNHNPDGNNSGADSACPKLSAKEIRRLFVLLLQALGAAKSADGSSLPGRRASNYKTKIVCVGHALSVRSGTQKILPPLEVEIRYFDESQAGPSNDPWIYQIAVSSHRHLEIGRLGRCLADQLHTGEQPFTQQEIDRLKPEYLEMFDMLTAQIANEATIATMDMPKPGMTMAGTSKFYPFDPSAQGLGEAFDLRNGLCALPGYSRSVRMLIPAPRLQLNINTTTSAFYRWESLRKVMQSQLWAGVFENTTPQNPNRVHACHWKELESFVRGLRVRAQYNNVSKIYTVTGLAMTEGRVVYSTALQKKIIQSVSMPWNPRSAPIAGTVTFRMDQEDAQGKKIKDTFGIIQKRSPPILVSTYFNTTLGVNIVSPQDFVVRTGGGERILYFPASVLTVLPGQNFKGKQATTFGARPPSQNKNFILGTGLKTFGVTALRNRPTIDARFGLLCGTQLLGVQGQRLNIPKILYRHEVEKAQSRWDLREAVSLASNSKHGEEWSFLDFSYGRSNWDTTRLRQFLDTFIAAARNFGMNLPASIGSDNDYADHKIDAGNLSQAMLSMKAKMQAYPEVKIWILLLPRKDTSLYSEIKIMAGLRVGISTMCHVKRGDKTQLQLCSNLCLKANLKLSRYNANHALKAPSTILGSQTMVVGIDVTHSGDGAKKHSPSIAAVVASHDKNCARWPASIKLNRRYQDDKKEALEEVQELKRMMTERSECFRRHRHKLPTRIIIYRDGLSEGQFEMAKTQELGRILAAIDALYASDNRPELMLVCAVKRHHTRFLPLNGVCDNKNQFQSDENPAPSTAFFDTVTYGDGQDFFLVSQNAMRGATVRPTHYVVLFNTIPNTSIQDVAQATLDLCFMFGRATTSVGLATPAYYADLAAGRAAQYLAPYTRADLTVESNEFDYNSAATIQLAPRDDPNKPGEHFGDSMFYL